MAVVTDTRWDVSVVIPAYNRAHLIGATLDAVLAQTHRPGEVVVIDDGSTDDTEAVVSRYGPQVQYNRIENSGVCHARNVGARLSSAPWIAFCDSDDLWRPEKLEWQVRLLRQAPDVEYVFCDSVVVRGEGWASATKFGDAPRGFWESGRHEIDPNLWIFGDPLYARLLRFQPIYPSTILTSRALFERVGGIDEQWGWTPAEDVEFVLRCAQRAPMGAVACPLVGIRKHPKNFSRDHLRTALGMLAILAHARLHHRPCGEQHAALLAELIQGERTNVVNFAFATGRTDIVRELGLTMPGVPRSLKLRLKLAVARLPDLFARPLCRALVLGADALARPRAAWA
ncbi:MAG: glycosyltransferase [Acidobacteria bacterium]|nr:glycosyltransferase [Acidobacteriota bacterium]